jgi:ankyrin repeat protein
MKFSTYSMVLLTVAIPIGAMQRAAVVYDPGNTNMLKSLLNLYNPCEYLPEKEIIALVQSGANPNIKADCGFCIAYSWLSILIEYDLKLSLKAKNLISFLLNNGANPNDIHAPLVRACRNADHANVTMLIAAGANVHARDDGGNSPLYVALGDPNAPNCYRNSIVKLLLEKGAVFDINVTNNKGESPYSFVKKYGLKDILELFEKYKSKTP